jgi:uncharacterized protein (DUF1330 family)
LASSSEGVPGDRDPRARPEQTGFTGFRVQPLVALIGVSLMSQPVYALNLFDVANKEEYLAYARRSAKEVAAHDGRVVALGRFRESAAGSIEPRTVLILVEWASKEAFDGYCEDPNLTDLHPHRVNGTDNYIWHLFDKLEDLRPILK